MCSCGACSSVFDGVFVSVFVSVFVYVACRFSVCVCVLVANVWYCVCDCCMSWYGCRVGCGWIVVVMFHACASGCV